MTLLDMGLSVKWAIKYERGSILAFVTCETGITMILSLSISWLVLKRSFGQVLRGVYVFLSTTGPQGFGFPGFHNHDASIAFVLDTFSMGSISFVCYTARESF